MLSGRRLDLLNPDALDIEIEDIAHGLARVSRWNGQTQGKYPLSVAQHCVLVERLFGQFYPKSPRKWRLACLLHDAPEYVIGDMISPFKAMLPSDYKTIEKKLEIATFIRFGLGNLVNNKGITPDALRSAIERADRTAAYMEATQLAGFSEKEARKVIYSPRNPPNIKIRPSKPSEAEASFLRRFAYLGGR